MIHAAYGLELERARRRVESLNSATGLAWRPDAAIYAQRTYRLQYNALADDLSVWGTISPRYNYRYEIYALIEGQYVRTR
jgi:hypothetical protein